MNWAEALSGLGAGLQGQGAQWQVAANDRLKTLSELDDKRKQAMLEDFRSTLVRLKSGDTGGASQLLQDRLEAITQLGGDPSDTAEINRMIQEGRIDEAVAGLQSIDDMAVANGKLPSIAPEVKIQGGQAFRTDPLTGKVTAAAIEGYDPALAGTTGSGKPTIQNGQLIVPDGKGGYMAQPIPGYVAPPTPQGPTMYSATTKVFLNGTTLQTDRDGGRMVTTPDGRTVAGAEAEAVLRQALKDEVSFTGNKAQAGQLGTDAASASTTAFETYQSVISAIPKYDMAIAALNKGANSGKIAGLFPTIQSATVELENVRNMMGLDLIAVSKFGALSEGERKTAMETAIPDLPPKELAVWLETKKRGQQKMAKLYADVAIYLGKPGNTLPMWLAEQQAKLDQQSGGNASPGGGSEVPEVPAAIDNSRSGAVLLEDANGNRAYRYPDGRIEEIN